MKGNENEIKVKAETDVGISFWQCLFCEFPEMWRTRQTLWGECTDANPKTVAKRYTIEKKLVPLQYES